MKNHIFLFVLKSRLLASFEYQFLHLRHRKQSSSVHPVCMHMIFRDLTCFPSGLFFLVGSIVLSCRFRNCILMPLTLWKQQSNILIWHAMMHAMMHTMKVRFWNLMEHCTCMQTHPYGFCMGYEKEGSSGCISASPSTVELGVRWVCTLTLELGRTPRLPTLNIPSPPKLMSRFVKVAWKGKVNDKVPSDIFNRCITIESLGLVCLGFFFFFIRCSFWMLRYLWKSAYMRQ